MSIRLPLILVVALAWFGVGVPGSSANPSCPSNTLMCRYRYDNRTITSTDSALSISCSSYDLVQGSLSAVAPVAQDVGCVSLAFAHATDVYQVEGVAAGTPLVFQAELVAHLAVHGDGCAHGPDCYVAEVEATSDISLRDDGSAQLVQASLSVRGYPCNFESAGLDTTIVLPMAHAAGDTFSLELTADAYSLIAYAGVSGQIFFSGLPAGASVMSCQGYHQDAATPTRRQSWGALKLLYR
jgi:hypothetical protein